MTWQSVAIAVAAGMLAAAVGVLVPLRGELSRPLRSETVTPRHRRRVGARRGAGCSSTVAGGIACLAVTTLILVFDPAGAILGIVILVVALLLLLAPLLDLAIRAFDRVQRRLRSAATRQAVIELRNPVTRTRSLAIAATGAIAVFGSVAIQGAHSNLQRGLDRTAAHLIRVTDVWVSVAGERQHAGEHAVCDQHRGATGNSCRVCARWRSTAAASSTSAIAGCGSLRRRRARRRRYRPARCCAATSRSPTHVCAPGAGSSSRRRSPMNTTYTSETRSRCPRRSPRRFRIAALSTNIGWSSGAIIMSSADYARAWDSSEASAYNIDLRAGVSPAQGAAEVRRALGPSSGLQVQTARERELEWGAGSRQGLSRLSQISALVLIAAALAMAMAMWAMIWQRRPLLAYEQRDGYPRGVLWRALIYESGLLLVAGCSIGAMFGLYGQVLLSHSLASVTGYPVVFSVGLLVAVESVALVSFAAAAIVAVPGYFAAGVAPSVDPG